MHRPIRLTVLIALLVSLVAAAQTAAVVSLIGATTSTAGLKVYAQLDENVYERGIKVADEQLAAVNLTRDEFHGEWNYLIKPST